MTTRKTTRRTMTTTATAFAASSWGAPPRQQAWVSARGSGRGTSCAARRGRRPCSAAASGRSRARPAAISGRSAAARPSCGRFRRRRRRTRRRRPNHPCSWARSGRPACCGGSGPCRSASYMLLLWLRARSLFVICGYRSDGFAAPQLSKFLSCELYARVSAVAAALCGSILGKARWRGLACIDTLGISLSRADFHGANNSTRVSNRLVGSSGQPSKQPASKAALPRQCQALHSTPLY